MKLRSLFFLLPLLALSILSKALTIPYGKSGKIVYNLQTGTFDIFENGKLILQNGFSTTTVQEQLLSSKAYHERKSLSTRISDRFGSGTRTIIRLKQAGLPAMEQVFYTYPNREHFLFELVIEGQHQLSSNQMSPIQGTIPAPQNYTALQSLFVPFDNDTFISYQVRGLASEKQHISSEVTALYNDQTRTGWIAGSAAHENWKTGIRTALEQNNIHLDILVGYTDKDLTRDLLPHGAISGKRISSPKIFFGHYADWRTGMEDYAKVNRLNEPPVVHKWTAPTPVGWNSWGVMQEKINYEKATAVVDFFADSLKNFKNEGVAYIDLDSFWDNMTSGGLQGDFSKLKAFADYTKKRGLKPGVYWAPFTDWGFKSGADRKAEGSNYTFGELWTKTGNTYHDLDGARALDPTHPGTQKRIDLVIGKLKDCGFEMIKIDFLGHAAIESDHFYDKNIHTGMQAYKMGMEYLLKQLDNKMLIYAAISPNMASGRYVHMRRIACDAFKSIRDTEYTLNSVSNGWWQTWLYDYLDADHVVFQDLSEGQNIARLLSAVVTGTVVAGDDYSAKGQWRTRAQELLQNQDLLAIVKDGKAFRPVGGQTGKGAAELFIKKSGSDYYLAAFNYSGNSKSHTIDLQRLGLPQGKTFTAQELVKHQKQTFSNGSTFEIPAESASIFKISTVTR